MKPDPTTFAAQWIDAWNAHDIDAILGHYATDCEITTPMLRIATNIDTDTLRGKDKIRSYWNAALEKMPDLHFELIEAAGGVDSIALCYRSVMEKMAIEVMFFDDSGKINRMIAHYT